MRKAVKSCSSLNGGVNAVMNECVLKADHGTKTTSSLVDHTSVEQPTLTDTDQALVNCYRVVQDQELWSGLAIKKATSC